MSGVFKSDVNLSHKCESDSLERRAALLSFQYSPKLLLAILLLAFVLRLAWMLTQAAAIENEGAEYARIAQNLLNGKGYTGILGGPETLFPPLYPFLIAAASTITRDAESAGRLISVVFGSLLVLPIFFIAQRFFGSRTAYLAGITIALHPLLVALSASVLVEATYLTLLFAGLHWGIRALDFTGIRSAIFSGLFLAFAYLARPEGLAYAALAGVFILLHCALSAAPRQLAFKYGATLVVTTGILATPYISYLSARSGGFRVEGKMAINQTINTRMNRGMSYVEAAYGLGPNLEAAGPYLTADQFSIKAPSETNSTAMALKSYFHGIGIRTRDIVIAVGAERGFGAPLICILVLVGLFRPRWHERKWLQEALLLSAAGLTLLILLILRFVWGRYLFAFLPFLVLWAAAGIDTIADSVAKCLSKASPKIAIQVVLTSTLLLAAAAGLPREDELNEVKRSYVKRAGLWLNDYKPGPKNIMAIGATIPYYANGTEFYLPYVDSYKALAYIHRKHPDFIVLRGDELTSRPYIRDWFEGVIPDSCAKLIRHTEDPVPDQVEIYQWTCSN